jgi:hypothetical protein
MPLPPQPLAPIDHAVLAGAGRHARDDVALGVGADVVDDGDAFGRREVLQHRCVVRQLVLLGADDRLLLREDGQDPVSTLYREVVDPGVHLPAGWLLGPREVGHELE